MSQSTAACQVMRLTGNLRCNERGRAFEEEVAKVHSAISDQLIIHTKNEGQVLISLSENQSKQISVPIIPPVWKEANFGRYASVSSSWK
jgi:hypothetical protein